MEETALPNNKFKFKYTLPVVQDKEESHQLNVLTAQTTPEFQMIWCHVLHAVLVGLLQKMVPAHPAQLDKLLLQMEDHAWSSVDQENWEFHKPNAKHAQNTPNSPLMENHVNLAQ